MADKYTGVYGALEGTDIPSEAVEDDQDAPETDPSGTCNRCGKESAICHEWGICNDCFSDDTNLLLDRIKSRREDRGRS